MDTATILKFVEHRPFPLPSDPWIMMQFWHELLFSHWPISTSILRALIPAQLEIDTFEGEAWVGIVPFRMSHVYPRGLFAVPKLSAFPELNVRTYVTMQGMPGVYFFSLDAGNPVAVALARTFFHLPYFNSNMSCVRQGESIYYHSHRVHRGAPSADYIASYRPLKPVVYAAQGSLEYWLTERYCLYSFFHDQLYRAQIHHAPWPLQIAEVETISDTMASSHGFSLPATQPLLHFSTLQKVLVWPLRHVQ